MVFSLPFPEVKIFLSRGIQGAEKNLFYTRTRGPFLERPGNLTGPVSYFEIKVSRKVCCVLTSNEAHLFL